LKFFFGLAIAGALLGGLVLVGGLVLSNGAPQEAAAAAIAVACGVLPYCVARAAHGIFMIDFELAVRDEQKTQTRLLASIANEMQESSRDPDQPANL
jgi:outer membrane lipoprotein SlyB